MKLVLNFIGALICLLLPLAQGNAVSLLQENQERIFINNRILAKANGKVISVIDIMKQLDLLFYKGFPQYVAFPAIRFQFYQARWKQILDELVDKELILADAVENKLPLTPGDIRQEMEGAFGPNIILNLDKAGLTFDDAWKMMEEELRLRRMLYIRVNSKAIRRVTPQRVRQAYEEYAKENVRPEQWIYKVITIRNEDATQAAAAADFAYQLLTQKETPLEELTTQIHTNESFGPEMHLTVSELFTHQESELSSSYKEVVVQLLPGTYSPPVLQKSRAANSIVFRIFYLDKHLLSGAPPFEEVADQLRQTLIQKEISLETIAYLKRLREHYHVQGGEGEEFLPENFTPFVLS
jgi:hypothetical protein